MEKIDTKYFGPVEYDPAQILTFPRGLFGFEDEREFLLLPFHGSGGLYCLQSRTTPGLAFVAVDPFALCDGYAPQLQPEELKELDVERSTDLFFYVLCAVKTPTARSTVNLRCPIAINDENRRCMQVILEDKQYGMRHLLCDVSRQEEESC